MISPVDSAAPPRRWLLRLVVSFVCTQGAVSMARPAVSYHALELGAGPRAVGVVSAFFALLPLAVAVPLGRHTDRRRCGPLLPAGAALMGAGCVLAGTASSLTLLSAWSAVLGLGHLVFMVGAQSLVARQSEPARHDRNFGWFTIGGSTGQLIGPVLAGLTVGGGQTAGAGLGGGTTDSSAVALFASAALACCAYTTLWGLEARVRPGGGSGGSGTETSAPHVSVVRILRARGVPAGIFASLAVLSTTDVLTAYLPVVGEERGIEPGVVGLLLSLRAAASICSRAALPAMSSRIGRQRLLVLSCLVAGVLAVLLAVPGLPVWALGLALAVLGFCLGVGQPLTMTTVVRAAPDSARSTALALRITGNRLGQVAAPACAGLVAGAAGATAPFVLLGAVLLGASGTAARDRGDGEAGGPPGPRAGSRAGSRSGSRAGLRSGSRAGLRSGLRSGLRGRVTQRTRRRTDSSN